MDGPEGQAPSNSAIADLTSPSALACFPSRQASDAFARAWSMVMTREGARKPSMSNSEVDSPAMMLAVAETAALAVVFEASAPRLAASARSAGRTRETIQMASPAKPPADPKTPKATQASASKLIRGPRSSSIAVAKAKVATNPAEPDTSPITRRPPMWRRSQAIQPVLSRIGMSGQQLELKRSEARRRSPPNLGPLLRKKSLRGYPKMSRESDFPNQGAGVTASSRP